MSTLKSKVKQLLEKNVAVRPNESDRSAYVVTFGSKKSKGTRLFVFTKSAGRYVFFLGEDGSYRVDSLGEGIEFVTSIVRVAETRSVKP